MGSNGKGPLSRTEEKLRFFKEIGADFVARAPRTSRAAGTSGREGLEAIAAEVQTCQRCGLWRSRAKTVPGEGSSSARLMFVGEAPGADEDAQGRPFVGRAGQLLDKIIGAMAFRRQDVFIANVLKCRPPNNRDPLPDEVEACSPFLIRQVETLRPAVIVALGKPAASFFTGQEIPISLLRGRFFPFRGIPVMPTFHPAFLLRNERSKKDVWEDMKQVMALLGEK